MMAVDTQEKFLRRFPKSNLRENMLLQVAKTYETLVNFEKAAYYYEGLFLTTTRRTPNPRTRSASPVYYWGSGNTKKAEGDMLAYLRSYPKDDKVVEKDLLSLYESQGLTDKEVGYYLHARAERGVSFSDYVAYSVRIAELQGQGNGHLSAKPMEEALKVAQRYPKEMSSTPKGVEAMSKLLFWFVKQKEDYFYSLKSPAISTRSKPT